MNTDIKNKLKENMVLYFNSILKDRAIASIGDGLKPIHRRIIYAMYEKNFDSKSKHVKSSKIVGEVMSNYSPHGNASTYNAMVNMVKKVSMKLPLVDGQGNFGDSLHGHSAAAERYSEARLAKLSEDLLLDNIEKNAVDFQDNYDNTKTEPSILPAKTCMLLVNGSFGIGGGFSASIPSHNVKDVAFLIKKFIKNENIKIEELIDGFYPDFPMKCNISDLDKIQNAYITGKNTFGISGDVRIDEKNSQLIVESLPYGISIQQFLNKLSDVVKNGTIDGISYVNDYSDKYNVNIEIGIKKGKSLEIIRNQLFKFTQLKTTSNIILFALDIDNKFKMFNILEIISKWVDFRISTISRIFKYDIVRYRERKHIIEGLLIAHDNINEIISIIKVKPKEDAKIELKKFSLTSKQIDYILEMKLAQLSNTNKNKLLDEHEELINKINAIIEKDNRDSIKEIINLEQDEIIKKYATNRVTLLVERDEEHDNINNIENLIEDEKNNIIVLSSGLIKRFKATIEPQNKAGIGNSLGKIKENDFIIQNLVCNNKDQLLVFTNLGNIYSVKVFEIDEISNKNSLGVNITNFIKLKSNEKVIKVLPLENDKTKNDNRFLVFGTVNGLVKKTKLSEYVNSNKNGIIAIRLDSTDTIVDVDVIENDDDMLILTSSSGNTIRYPHKEVTESGRDTVGKIGMKLNDNEKLVGLNITNKELDLLFLINNNGIGKVVSINEFPEQKRTYKSTGRMSIALKEHEYVEKTLTVNNNDSIIISTNDKNLMLNVKKLTVLKRPAYGSTLIKINKNQKIIDISKIGR